MAQLITFPKRYEELLADEAPQRDTAAVVEDLTDQLTVICDFANLGVEASDDPEQAENYFMLIESAGEKAVQITRQLQVLDPSPLPEAKPATAVHLPSAQYAIDATIDPRQGASSFRRRLIGARALVKSAGVRRPKR